MKISVAECKAMNESLRVVVRSLEGSLYLISVDIAGNQALLTDNNGEVFRCYNLASVRESLAHLSVCSLVMHQESAYDEMVGQPQREASNRLEVPLATPKYLQ